MSSYLLSFFEKLVICRGLKFSLPQKVAPAEIKANFEKGYWKVEQLLEDPGDKELASSTLRSIALNYIQRKSPSPPKDLVKALNVLKKRGDIVVTKPDKGSKYLLVLSAASVDDTTKFARFDDKRPNLRGRPPKHYHPLLQKGTLNLTSNTTSRRCHFAFSKEFKIGPSLGINQVIRHSKVVIFGTFPDFYQQIKK